MEFQACGVKRSDCHLNPPKLLLGGGAAWFLKLERHPLLFLPSSLDSPSS
jgi:hypothetical protein